MGAANAYLVELARRLGQGTGDGRETTVGREPRGLSVEDECRSAEKRGHCKIPNTGEKTDAELSGYLHAIADTLSFANDFDAAYHAHKHARELPTRPRLALDAPSWVPRSTPGGARDE
jgi:hypothetical protein